MLFFGLVGVGGSFYLHAQLFEWTVIFPALAVGFLSTGVLNLNNMRDIESDSAAGKNTLVVKNGIIWAKNYHYVMIGGAMLMALLFILFNSPQAGMFLFLLCSPLLVRHVMVVRKAQIAGDFDPELKKLALTTLLFVLLFGVGIIL